MPTYKKIVNTALQYNQNDLSDYLLSTTDINKKFLTECPLNRTIRSNELSALYFLVGNTASFSCGSIYQYFDINDNLVYEKVVNYSAEGSSINPISTHNAIPINLVSGNPFFIPNGVTKLKTFITTNANLLNNGNFKKGSGTTFSSWLNFGTITESIDGGIDGSRCPVLAYNSALQQTKFLLASTSYTIRFCAKTLASYSGSKVVLSISGVDVAETESLITTDYQQFTFIINNTTAGAKNLKFTFLNDAGTGSLYFDDVSVRLSVEPNAMTETRTFILDDICSNDEKQVVWMNKLGGFDSWTFLGGQQTEIAVKREVDIEYTKDINFNSPNRIYANRSNLSKKSLSLATRVNKQIAQWLRSELIDSIDVYFIEDGYYIPVNVKDASVNYNSWENSYIVKMNFEYAFPNNIQTR